MLKNSLIYKQLAVLLKAGLPLNKALKILALQSEAVTSKRILMVSSELEGGASFHDALYKHKLISSDLKQSFKIAEESAFLPDVLERTAALYEKNGKLRHELRKALTYPLLVLGLSLMSIIFLFVYIVPAYSKMFLDSNFKLPAITVIALNLPNYGIFLLLLFIPALLIVLKSVSDHVFRFRLPLAGEIFKTLFLRDFCHSLGYQLKNGTPLIHALGSIKESTSCAGIKGSFVSIIDQIERGESLSSALGRDKAFAGSLPQLVAVGEGSGSLSQMLFYAGEQFECIAESKIQRCMSYIEPAATLCVGGVVAFVALSMIMPLFSMVNSLL